MTSRELISCCARQSAAKQGGDICETIKQRVFKLALANASRHVLLRSKVLECLIRIMLCYEMMLRNEHINQQCLIQKSSTETEVYGG